MPAFLTPLSFLIACLSGWLNEHQQRTIEYLAEENRVLREQIGDRRLRFTDDQRRRLAVRAKELRRSALMQVATIVTPKRYWHGTANSLRPSTTAAVSENRADRGRTPKS